MSSPSPYRSSDASSAFFAIPELIENLCSSLNNNHILRLMQTNKALSLIAAPCLWRNVDLEADYRVEQLYTFIEKQNNSSSNRVEQLNTFIEEQNDNSNDYVQTFVDLAYRTRSLKAGFAFLSYYLEGVFKMTDTDNTPLPRSSWIRDHQAKLFSTPIPLITQLSHLDVSLLQSAQRRTAFFASLSQAPPLIPRLSRFIACNSTTLTDVRLRNISPSVVDIRYLCRVITLLTRLVNLTIEIPQANTSSELKLTCSIVSMIFFCCPLSLESFELTTTVREDGSQDGTTSVWTPTKMDLDFEEGVIFIREDQLSSLKVLKLPHHETGYRTALLKQILEHCPVLEEWDIPFLHDADNVAELIHSLGHNKSPSIPKEENLSAAKEENLSATKEGRPLTLQYIQFTHPGTDGKGETAAAIMKKIPKGQLKSLTFYGYEDTHSNDTGDFGPFTASLLRHSASCVTIKLQNIDWIHSKTIKGILTSCTALETLVMTCPETMLSRLLLDDATIQDWKCVNLKELRMIVDLRPGSDNQHEMLEKFYNQLGALKNLEILDLMAASRATDNTSAHYSNTTMTCMLSLGSTDGRQGYLNSLAGLKSLRLLLGSFFLRNQEMREMFGKNEVDWILREWPSLETIEFFTPRDAIRASHPCVYDMRRQRPNLTIYRKEQ
ncbi:hypothetical protein EC991_009082 [Linnemannia zychae]|nr:hypothetical protein EC991_009082 [Linnemannia zychae]